jgi:hypothetical protein
MDRCPPEIWSDIFKLLCVDGGAAGCSLALVSRRFRELADPERLHSVRVNGFAQLQAVLKFVSARPPHLRNVRHLYLAGAPDRRPYHGNLELGSAYRAAYDALITVVAPHICTLSVSPTHGLVSFESLAPADVALPLLRDLTVECDAAKAEHHVVDVTLPSLRRLHIHGMDSFPRVPLFELITYRAPALKHLRLEAHCIAALPGVLAAALGRTGLRCLSELDPNAGTPSLPSSLAQVMVRPVVIDYRNRYLVYMDGSRHWIMTKGLKELVASNCPQLPRVLLLDQGVHEDADYLADWTDVVKGGAGCFAKGSDQS